MSSYIIFSVTKNCIQIPQNRQKKASHLGIHHVWQPSLIIALSQMSHILFLCWSVPLITKTSGYRSSREQLFSSSCFTCQRCTSATFSLRAGTRLRAGGRRAVVSLCLACRWNPAVWAARRQRCFLCETETRPGREKSGWTEPGEKARRWGKWRDKEPRAR